MMKRRTCLQSALGIAALAAARGAGGQHPIELHVELSVNPAKEREMLDLFHNAFRPAASRQPGFIEAKMLKFDAAKRGDPPAGNYRFVLLFQSEEQRQAWVATPEHQKIWPMILATLTKPEYTAILYEPA